MAGHELDVFAQGPELTGNGLDQLGMISAWKVGAADRSLEQHVAHLGEASLAIEKDNVARGVAGAVPDLEYRLAHLDRIAFA